jgi:hypothetical protein
MIDVAKAEGEAALWGIPLSDWMELRVRMFGNVDAFGDPEFDDEPDEEWRAQVSHVLVEHKMFTKANRFTECSRYAYTYECEGPERHQLFSPIYCDLRFCPRCGPRQFARLIEKYMPIITSVCSQLKPDFLLREITLTTRNTGSISAHDVKQFNLDVKMTLKALMGSVKGWGAIWCDEVGFNNTNLHAHVLFYGPYISQDALAATWKEISGHEVVYIKKAPRRGNTALIHLLKYVSKPPASDPNLIGLLEVAFHGCRRVHAVGIFYNFAKEDPDNKQSVWTTCPHCGAEITKLPGAIKIEKAILEGRTFVGTKFTARRKEWVN